MLVTLYIIKLIIPLLWSWIICSEVCFRKLSLRVTLIITCNFRSQCHAVHEALVFNKMCDNIVPRGKQYAMNTYRSLEANFLVISLYQITIVHLLGLHMFWNFCPRDATFMHQCCNYIMPACYHIWYKTYELLSIILCMIHFGKKNTFMLVIQIKRWVHWCNSNVIHLYFGSAQYKFLPRHFRWLRFPWFSPDHHKYEDSPCIRPLTFFHISFHLSSISSSTIG